MVRDGLSVVASDQTGHIVSKPRANLQGLHITPARAEILEQSSRLVGGSGMPYKDPRKRWKRLENSFVTWQLKGPARLSLCMVSFSDWVTGSYSETQLELHNELTGTCSSWRTSKLWSQINGCIPCTCQCRDYVVYRLDLIFA